MKVPLLVLVLLLSMQEAPPYPPGWHCTPTGIVKDGRQTHEHPCACKRVDTDQYCEGQPSANNVCQQWCHNDRCGCPWTCEPTTPSPEE